MEHFIGSDERNEHMAALGLATRDCRYCVRQIDIGVLSVKFVKLTSTADIFCQLSPVRLLTEGL